MASKKMKIDDEFVTNTDSAMINGQFEDIISDRFGAYSKYIIQDRALPDIRDGLKPVQRRILFGMKELGIVANTPYKKSARIVGDVMGKYHPHGDSSIYDAMVRMSQWWKSNEVLIDMHGNNGSIDNDPAAAMRYTETRLSSVAMELLKDIDEDTVEFTFNFDATLKEPTVLPARFPALLINGSKGIAAGFATDIPPHNLSEVVEGTIHRIKNPNCRLETMMDIIKGPDFPTGGIAYGKKGIIDAFSTGKGKIILRGKAEVIEDKQGRHIVISEIPYDIVKISLVKRIDEIRFNKEIWGMVEVRDESDRNGLKIVVDITKEADAQLILNYLYKESDLQTTYNYNMVAIDHKTPRQVGILSILDAYIEHKREITLRKSQYNYDKKMARLHIIDGLIKAISIVDELIDTIKKSKNKADAKENIIAKYQFSEKQAEAILMLQLYRLSSTDITKLEEEQAILKEEIIVRGYLSNTELSIKESRALMIFDMISRILGFDHNVFAIGDLMVTKSVSVESIGIEEEMVEPNIVVLKDELNDKVYVDRSIINKNKLRNDTDANLDIFDYQFILANFKEMMKQVALVAGISPNDCEVKVLDILGNCA